MAASGITRLSGGLDAQRANEIAQNTRRALEQNQSARLELTKNSPSPFIDHKDMIWRPEWSDAAVGAKFKYDGEGSLQLPLYKAYGADGTVRVFYRGEAPDGSSQAQEAGKADDSGKVSSKGPAAWGGDLNSPSACGACSSRHYKDGSNDMGVSFKMSGKISAEASVAKVSSHESEHVSRANREEQDGDYTVYTQKRIHMSQCPECKRMYASGGVTEVIKVPKHDEASTEIEM